MADAGRPFVHLHVHSQYSLLDGACRTADMVARAKELNQPALAITDHGCLFVVVDFYNKATAAGIKPLLGIEAYMAPGKRTDRQTTGVKDGGYHLLLLAENRQGYRNLLKLSSIAFTEGFYYKPRIDKEALQAHREGLIATSACLGGEIPAALMLDNRKKAREIAELYLSVFGADRFFIEIQKHIPEQDKVNPELIDLADKLGIGVVATNDVHFLLKDDHAPHDALCCISTGKLVSDESRMKYPTQLYLKSGEEMLAASEHRRWPEACENTVRIAQMCDVALDFKTSHAPVVKIERVVGAGGLGLGSEEEGKKPARGTPTLRIPSSDPRPRTPDPAPGSTDWFKAVCAGYQLQPFDELRDREITAADLKTGGDRALRELAEAGLTWRYGEGGVTPEHRARLDRELTVLANKNISAYFLIVWDFVNYARSAGIPALARGSGVGTMVGYCLGLSNACPVRYGLLFERFTDPDRSEYPDIDIDICQDGRQAVIEYVRRKYGHVAQIITFGTLKARAAIRDVGRVLNVPLGEVDKLCKLVGEALGMTLDKALEQEPDLRKLYDENPLTRKMIDTARRLEGLARHAGVHAAGVVIATQPLDNIIPLYKPPGTEQVVTQWDGPTVEKVGLLKMDFLGLRTLSIVERAKALIRATLSPEVIRETVIGSPKSEVRSPKSEKSRSEGTSAASPTSNFAPQTSHFPHDPLDLDRLSFDDQRVLDLFRRGETAGVFQFESGGMRNLLMAMKPDRLEDLIAANALFRPGPMDLIPDYCDRKHGRAQAPKVHDLVDGHTDETYGVMVYQEQVMQIVHGLGGIPLRAAYTLIKNISKKKQKDIDAVRPTFIEGAKKQGLTAKAAEELFELILKFAGYGFNKSHSTGYAIVAYQTAYLKTHFPVQYMAAVLTYESVDTTKVVEYIEECRRALFPDGHRGIQVKPPDINLSEVGFTVVYEDGEPHDANHGHIRFGLSAVKGVGDKAIEAIIQTRAKGGAFKGLYDFCERVPLGSVNRATIEALVKCGAFDSVHGTERRAAMLEALEGAIQAGQWIASDRSSGQLSFLDAFAGGDAPGGAAEPAPAPQLPRCEPWPTHELLKHEKSVLGFYVSSHPLDPWRDTLERFATASVAEAKGMKADVQVLVGGMLTRVRPTFVKNGRSAGQKMAMITLEDLSPAHADGTHETEEETSASGGRGHAGGSGGGGSGGATIEGVIFSDAYAIAAPLLETDKIVFLRGKIDRRREEPNLIVEEVIPIEAAAAELTHAVQIVLRDTGPMAAVPRTASAPAIGKTNGNGHRPLHRVNGNGHGHAPHASVTRYNGSLSKLVTLLRQSAAPHHAPGAGVFVEVHQDGLVARMRLNGLRVAVDRDLPERVATVLHEAAGRDCCRLLGPPKLLRGLRGKPGQAGSLLHREEPGAPRQQPLLRHVTPEDEVCESIDRY